MSRTALPWDGFEHEKEVRITYFEGDQIVHGDGVYKYPLDPLAVFDQVMIDPRLSYKEFQSFKDEIVARTGIDEARIKRSLLYKPPDGFIVEIP